MLPQTEKMFFNPHLPQFLGLSKDFHFTKGIPSGFFIARPNKTKTMLMNKINNALRHISKRKPIYHDIFKN